MWTILLIVLLLTAFGSAPAWPYSRGWGYGPSGVLGLLLAVLIVLMLLGQVPFGFGNGTTVL